MYTIHFNFSFYILTQDDYEYYDVLAQIVCLLRSNSSVKLWGFIGPGDYPGLANFVASFSDTAGLITVQLLIIIGCMVHTGSNFNSSIVYYIKYIPEIHSGNHPILSY